MIAHNSKDKLLEEWNASPAQSHGRKGNALLATMECKAFSKSNRVLPFVLPALSLQVDGRRDKAALLCLQATVEIVTQQCFASDLRSGIILLSFESHFPIVPYC